MLRLAADENFNGDIVRGLLRRNPTLDIVRVQDVGLSGADDPSVLQWAAKMGMFPRAPAGATITAQLESRRIGTTVLRISEKTASGLRLEQPRLPHSSDGRSCEQSA